MKEISKRDNMVICDHWSYMTMPGVLEMVFTALHEDLKIGRLS